MTFQQQIEAALKKPVDLELMAKAEALTLELTRVQATHRQSPCADLLYTLLLRIRDLETSLSLSQSTVKMLRVAVEGNQKVEQAQNDKITDYCNRILELEAQVEQERWRDATKEKPDSGVMVLCLGDGICFVGTWSEHLKKWQEGPSVRQVWKWKPIYILQ